MKKTQREPTRDEIAADKKIKEFVNRLPKEHGERRRWPVDLKKDVLEYYHSFESYHPTRKKLLAALKITPHTLTQWKRRDKVAKTAKVKALKTNSIAAKNRIMGTNLARLLNKMENEHIVDKVTMLTTLTSSGFKEEEVLKEMKCPTTDEFKAIMKAVAMVADQYVLVEKEQT